MERAAWLNRDKKAVWHPFTQMLTDDEPLLIERAEGALLFDADGRSYIDANSSWWVNVHGHGHPHIAQAVAAQFSLVDHVIFAGATHKQAIRLAERVVNILPKHFSKVFFSDDGSTAVEVALKMVFQFWHNKQQPKKRIIALEGAYHGDTFGAMAVGQRGYFNDPFEHFFFDVDFLPFPDKEDEQEALRKAQELFETGEIAGIIVEPIIQGSAGMRVYSAEWLDQLITLAHRYEALVIFDEVMTGWGRTGRLFAMDHCVNKPDVVCLSKGLTGGTLPLGLTVATEEIYEAFLHPEKTKALLHGHSYTGNPLVCAAANASLDIFEEDETWANIERIETAHHRFLNELQQLPNVVNAAVCGTILRFEIETGEGNTYFSDIRDKAYRYFLENGCLIRPLGNVVFVNPPYCITDVELRKIYDVMLGFLKNDD
ncbi:MAG TPA: adenosylmethionine--8-amino-7-oxononanoate transaminase [Fluviicola sp.]|nr:adenosylmethionine--8-amino-7-oxononanoate transaminase [Fluviicola sp.]